MVIGCVRLLGRKEPLPWELARSALSWAEEDLIRAAGADSLLFPVQTARHHVLHKSVTDWLSDRERAGGYVVDRDKGHQKLAVGALEKLATEADAVGPAAGEPPTPPVGVAPCVDAVASMLQIGGTK